MFLHMATMALANSAPMVAISLGGFEIGRKFSSSPDLGGRSKAKLHFTLGLSSESSGTTLPVSSSDIQKKIIW